MCCLSHCVFSRSHLLKYSSFHLFPLVPLRAPQWRQWGAKGSTSPQQKHESKSSGDDDTLGAVNGFADSPVAFCPYNHSPGSYSRSSSIPSIGLPSVSSNEDLMASSSPFVSELQLTLNSSPLFPIWADGKATPVEQKGLHSDSASNRGSVAGSGESGDQKLLLPTTLRVTSGLVPFWGAVGEQQVSMGALVDPASGKLRNSLQQVASIGVYLCVCVCVCLCIRAEGSP
jgi:hypothetical protein